MFYNTCTVQSVRRHVGCDTKPRMLITVRISGTRRKQVQAENDHTEGNKSETNLKLTTHRSAQVSGMSWSIRR